VVLREIIIEGPLGTISPKIDFGDEDINNDTIGSNGAAVEI